MSPTPPWLIYALGGGMGHLTRAVALARAAVKAGGSVQILTNSPFAEDFSRDSEILAIPPHLNREETCRRVHDQLTRLAPQTLIVDTFPRGLGGELATWLPGFSGQKILVHRDISEAYVEEKNLRATALAYDLILLPGEAAPLADLPRAQITPTWLVRDREEICPPAEARTLLQAPPDDLPLVALLGCGRPAEIQAMATLAARLDQALNGKAHIRLISPLPAGKPQVRVLHLRPLLAAMAGIDLLVGAGGYNTVSEARATGTPLVAIARGRLYDRQAKRLAPTEMVANEDGAHARVMEAIRTGTRRETPSLPYENGTHQAVRLIAAL